jgi:hypothetical protein
MLSVDANLTLPNRGSSVGIAFIASTNLMPSLASFVCAIVLIRCAVALYMPACIWFGMSPFARAAGVESKATMSTRRLER